MNPFNANRGKSEAVGVRVMRKNKQHWAARPLSGLSLIEIEIDPRFVFVVPGSTDSAPTLHNNNGTLFVTNGRNLGSGQ